MKHFEIVEADRFDQRDLAEMVELSPKLRSSLATIEDATPAGSDLGPDLWTSLIRLAPRKHEEIPPSHRVNETVIDRIWEADHYRDLKQHTVGDAVATAAGLSTLAREVTSVLSELGDVTEQAEKAQAAQDALEDAMAGQGQGASGDGEPGDTRGGDIDELRSDAEAQAELLDEMIDEQLPRIDAAVRAGLGEAAADAEDQADVAAGWGLDPGEAQRMDPAERIRLMQSFSDDRMRKIADLVGSLHNLAIGERDRRFEYRPGEVVGVTLGGDLARLVPGELANLALPELEDLMILRAVQRRARIYLTRTVERAGRGAVIYVEDQSGSMAGQRAIWSKAFGLALLRVARDQDRAFHAIVFRGPGEWERFDFPPKAAVTDRMVAFASTQPNGGTEITGPLDEAVALLQAEYDKGGNIEGDIVLATDGELGVPSAWLTEFEATRDRLAFNVYGVGIGGRFSTLSTLCTHVADIRDLTSGRDAAALFQSVQ